MYRKFIATVTAASIALTALGAVPAFADNYRAERALAAILGLAVVGAIVHENRKDKKKQPVQVHGKPKHHGHQGHHGHKNHGYAQNPPVYHPEPRPLPNRVNRKLLPQQCFRSMETRHGKVRYFGQRCLNRNYDFVHRLPQVCNYTFRTHKGDRRGYEARCLRDWGYRLARG